MKKITRAISSLFLSLLLTTLSCDSPEVINPEKETSVQIISGEEVIKNAQTWYESSQADTSEKGARKKNSLRKPDWKKAKLIQIDKKDQWMIVVPVADLQHPILSTQLVLFGDSEQNFKAMAIQKIPDSAEEDTHVQTNRSFSGKINILDENFQLVKENLFLNGKLTGTFIHSASTALHAKENSRTASDSDCPGGTICLPQVIVFAERITDYGPAFWTIVPYSYYPDWSYSNVGDAHGTWNEEYNGWNVDIPASGYMMDANQVVAPPDKPVLDVSKYLACFTNQAGSTYKVTLCVDQPVAGNRTKASLKDKAGHAFLLLEQSSPVGTVTRSIGFYPQDNVTPVNTTSIGIFNNDSNTEYDVSLTANLDWSTFQSLINNLSTYQANTYDLNTNNCTDMCLATMAAINISLPDTQGDWFNGGGSNPADLGEDLRSMPLKPGMSRNTSGGKSPANTGCED